MNSISQRIIKLVKETNGNVLLMKLDNTLIASFSSAQNVLRIPEAPSQFKIQSNASFGENPLILDYNQVDNKACVPVIEADNFNDFLIELSKKFFFVSNKTQNGSGATDNLKKSLYGIVRPTFVHSKDFITKNSKFIRFQRLVGAAYPSDITVEYGGFAEDTLTPYTKPFFGGTDLDPLMSNPYASIEYLYSLDDLFFRFNSNSFHRFFDVKLIVNPDNNTFSFMSADPLHIRSHVRYDYKAISDTWYLSLSDDESNTIQSFLRWKNVPELEIAPQ
jgi:hypothetical protein